MKNIITANIIILTIAALSITILFLLYIKAEIKLAKYGESTFFVNKEKKNKRK